MKGLTCKQFSQLVTIVQDTQKSTGLEEMAFITLMRICRDYTTPSLYPQLRGADRDRWFMERLGKFRIRFFERI